jgi:methyl-accepting chemotaxis protein
MERKERKVLVENLANALNSFVNTLNETVAKIQDSASQKVNTIKALKVELDEDYEMLEDIACLAQNGAEDLEETVKGIDEVNEVLETAIDQLEDFPTLIVTDEEEEDEDSGEEVEELAE